MSRTQNQNCQRSTVPLRYTAKPDLRHLSDQDRLDPEPGRTPTPRMGLVRLSRNTQNMRLQPPVKRKPEDFSRSLTRFYVNSAWVNFSSISPSDRGRSLHVLQNLHLGIVRISNTLNSFREIVRRMRKLNVRSKQEPLDAWIPIRHSHSARRYHSIFGFLITYFTLRENRPG